MTSAVIVNTAHGGCSTYLHTCPEHVHRLVCSCLVSIEAAGDTVKSHQNEPYEGIPSEGQVQMTVRNKTPTDMLPSQSDSKFTSMTQTGLTIESPQLASVQSCSSEGIALLRQPFGHVVNVVHCSHCTMPLT